jgi:hypothetical protein
LKLKTQDLEATDAAKVVAIQVLSRARNRPNFGNGGEVENQLSQAKGRYQTRQALLPSNQKALDVVFEPQDFDPNFDRDAHSSDNLEELFEDVVGCEDIIRKLGGYQRIARKMKARGMDTRDSIPTNFIFKGPPGNVTELVLSNRRSLIRSQKALARRLLRVRWDKSITTWVFCPPPRS